MTSVDKAAQDAACLPQDNAAAAQAAVWVVSLYIAAQVISNVASLKIGVVGGLAVDMGTFLYPITFTLRDVAHKTIGRSATRSLIYSAGAANLFMAAFLALVTLVPGDPSWGLTEQFTAILAPVWRLVAASILAQVVSELADTEVYHWFVTRITTRHQWLRVLASNGVSVPLDNLIFAVGAFGFALPWATVWDIFVVNLLVKFGVTLLSLPMIYLAPERDREVLGRQAPQQA